MIMTDAEKALYVKMVEMMVEHYPDSVPKEGEKPHFDSFSCSAFDAMRQHLINLGLATGYYKVSTLSVAAAQVRPVLETSLPSEAPEFSQLLTDWVYLFSSYPPVDMEALPTTRQPFEVNEIYRDALNLLAALGYAKIDGKIAVWTDSISPSMRAFYQWSEDLHDYGDIENARLEREISAAVATMTPDIRAEITQCKDLFGILKFVSERWNGSDWTSPPKYPETSITFLKPFTLAVIRHLRSKN